MMPMLAQFQAVSGNELGGWLLCLFAVLGALNQGAAFIARFKDTPPARDTYATIPALGEVKEDVEKLRQDIIRNYNQIMEKSAESRSRLHKEIQDVAASVHRIEGYIEAQTKK